MSKKKSEKKVKRGQNNFKLRNEYYGTEPIEECFRKAFEPYFDPEKSKEYYTDKLGK